MGHRFFIGLALLALVGGGTALASECPGNSDALGTSRILTLDTSKGLETGLQYHKMLPLQDKEVVLTFDDGPIPLYSERVRKALKAECVQATYFLVGTNALAYPDFVRKLAADGHSIGTHTMTHAMNLNHMPEKKALSQVDRGIYAVAKAMKTSGNPEAFAPFFRFPGLGDNPDLRKTLEKRGMGIFDIDAEGGDWLKHYSPDDVLKRVMNQLHRERRGIVLLHDIQPRTAAMVPAFLRQLKKEGFKVVHIVPMQPVIDDTVTVASADAAEPRPSDAANTLRPFEPEDDPALQAAKTMTEGHPQMATIAPSATAEPGMSKEVQALLKSNGQKVAAIESSAVVPPSATFAASTPDEKKTAEPEAAFSPPAEEKARKVHTIPHKRRLNPSLVRQERGEDTIDERHKLYAQRQGISPSAAYAPHAGKAYAQASAGTHPPASKYLLNSLFDSLRGTN